jgi:hypothetical protein
MAECRARLLVRAAEYRDRLRQLVTPEELAALEDRRQVLPSGEEYEADFWHRQLRRLTEGGGNP